MNDNEKKSLLFRIGLGRKSGKLISGTEMVCDGVRDGKVIMIIMAGNASDNSKKRILNCAAYYNTEVLALGDITTEELGRAIGKSAVACLGVTDENIVALVKGNRKE